MLQAAARISKTDEVGSWILVNVLYYDASTDRYEVQDEDDINRLIKLDASEVRKLQDSTTSLRRGDKVLAVFPETTSFYRATIAKNPSGKGESGAAVEDVIVRFEDDEDEHGKSIARRVPVRFVLPNYENETEDAESVDGQHY